MTVSYTHLPPAHAACPARQETGRTLPHHGFLDGQGKLRALEECAPVSYTHLYNAAQELLEKLGMVEPDSTQTTDWGDF